jgi:hypothetical protein
VKPLDKKAKTLTELLDAHHPDPVTLGQVRRERPELLKGHAAFADLADGFQLLLEFLDKAEPGQRRDLNRCILRVVMPAERSAGPETLVT